MRNFKELKVWEKAHVLTLAVYKATATFPREELYGLISAYPANPVRGRPQAKIPSPAVPRLSAPFGKGGGEGAAERGI